jgi:hypothetical protein
VLGDLTVKGDRTYPEFYPAAITEEQWFRARAALSARRIGRKGVGRKGEAVANLFGGLVRDAADGEVMHLHSYVVGNVPNRFRRALVSAGALRGEAGSTFTQLPYHLLENAFIRFVRELKPADFLGGDRSHDEEELSILDGKRAELETRIAKAKARLDASGGGVDALLDLLVKWDTELKGVKQQRETVASRLATHEADSLSGVQDLLDRLSGAGDAERAELRERLKARIRQIVDSIWVLLWDVSSTIKSAEIAVNLRGGNTRSIAVSWCRAADIPACPWASAFLSVVLGTMSTTSPTNAFLIFAPSWRCESSSRSTTAGWFQRSRRPSPLRSVRGRRRQRWMPDSAAIRWTNFSPRQHWTVPAHLQGPAGQRAAKGDKRRTNGETPLTEIGWKSEHIHRHADRPPERERDTRP